MLCLCLVTFVCTFPVRERKSVDGAKKILLREVYDDCGCLSMLLA